MNSRHAKVTDWGLSHILIKPEDTILDVGCGGGKTVSKLADLARRGKIYGVDYAEVCVAMARTMNQAAIDAGRVEIREGSVSALPFDANAFELVTAVETHFWWPDLPVGVAEIRRVLKPGGTLIIIAEVYKGATTGIARLVEKHAPKTGIKLLTPKEHENLLMSAAYSEVKIIKEASKGWICAMGKKPVV